MYPLMFKRRIILWTAVCFLVPFCPVAGETPAPVDAGDIDALIDRLAHPQFSERESATRRLCELGLDALPELAHRYRASEDFETKRRLRYVVEYLFHRDQLAEIGGFLGISVHPSAIRVMEDPAGDGKRPGVIVQQVHDGFAAKRAGMRDADVILAFNNEPVPDDTNAFIQLVSSHRPGMEVPIRVWRAAEAPREIEIPLADDPNRTLDGVTFEASPHMAALSGLRILSVAPDSPAAGLGLPIGGIVQRVRSEGQVGANVELQPHNAHAILNSILQTGRAGDRMVLQVVDFTEVPLEVRLGSRPVELMQEDTMAAARQRFLQWWREQGGELVLRTEMSSSWPSAVRVRRGAPPVGPLETEGPIIP